MVQRTNVPGVSTTAGGLRYRTDVPFGARNRAINPRRFCSHCRRMDGKLLEEAGRVN